MIDHRFMGSNVENIITIDPYSGKTLAVSSATGLSFADRLFAANEAVHTGSILGITGRVLMALAGIMVLPQAVSALMMWLKRIKSTKRRKVHRTGEGVSK